jgi:hypothetical protein
MSIRTLIILFMVGIISPIVIAQYQPVPGYLDSDYYFAGGIQLVSGKGFTEPYLWNYLDGTTSLPHPSHGYWAPLASIVAALGMWLTGNITYASARIFFIMIAGLVPPLTAILAFKFSKNRRLALISAALALFSVYHAPFLGVTDNFGIYILLGALFFIVITHLMELKTGFIYWLMLGILAGLMTLARSDGILWLGLTVAFSYLFAPKDSFIALIVSILRNSAVALAGFLMVMTPWYLRNINAYGSLVAPGGSRVLWLDNYDQTFIYPPAQLNLNYFLSLGFKEIFKVRMWALSINLQSAFAAHGGIILFPFIILGIIYFRRDIRVRLAALAWLILFFAMTFIFPFAGARGAFFHAGAALQPIWWTLAPLGLDHLLDSLRKRGWGNDQTRLIFQSSLVMIAFILTVFVVYTRLIRLGWGEGEAKYPLIEQFLLKKGIRSKDIVIVRNAPGYYLETRRSAISIPYGGEQAIMEVARQFGAHYLVIEPEAALPPIRSLYQDSSAHPHFIYLGKLDETHIYKIEFE